jgi:RHS repeat-associated protein
LIRKNPWNYVGLKIRNVPETRDRATGDLNTSANAPLFTQSYRMLADGNLADLHRVAAGWWDRDEFIYLQGMPVGVTHTDNSNPVPVSYWLSPDMMGTPRRILTRDATLTQVGRLVMDPWGAAVLLPDNSRNVGTGSIPARVWLPHRLPGQLQGQFEPFVDNQHRMYFPDARSYLSADPEHGSSAMTPGPQAYTYANGNPFKFSDPTGLYFLNDAGGCKKEFPVLHRVVTFEMPANGYNPLYRNVFKEMFEGPNGADLLQQGCRSRSGPSLYVGGRQNGRFAYTVGDTVSISRHVVDRIESNPSLSWFYHVVLLHELAHWVNARAGGIWDSNGREAGSEFERRAYGAVLGMP